MNPTKEQLADPKWWDENAPEDATHFTPAVGTNSRPVFWRVTGGVARECWVMAWGFSSVRDHFTYDTDGCIGYFHERAIERPAPWNGEGLPPVGTVCEVKGYPEGVFCEAEIIAYNNDQSKFWYCADGVNGIHETNKTKFRPLRTPEQIAAEEREKAIRDITNDSWGLCDYHGACYLYDAGYRKQEQK